ncbi:MAG: T9SS type A sorting domain-containing protein, partial [Candidatus Syntrophosphaera sp.]
INIYGTNRKGWLVTPPIDLGTAKTDYALEFDIALTDYYNAAPPDDPNGYSGVDDKFAVIISLDGGLSWTTANILAMWDNDPATDTFVYNDVPHTGQHITIPLSGFSGLVKIAFYGESTVSNADNDFFVDNVMIDEAGEPPTPVELSSFTAAVTADTEVTLTWVTESETQMMGYQIYRATSDDQSASTLISNTMIPATNTSSTHTYTRVDSEVEIGGTYFYWLESVGYNNSQFFGPVSVTVEGNVPPVMPEVTSMKSAYPNPFRAGTNIEIGLKAGETGTVTIYNVHGQVVKSFAVTQGYHTLNWDGRDANNSACASGIYFYKLSTPSFNQTMKMMLIK